MFVFERWQCTWNRLSGDVFTGVNLSAVAADGNGFIAVGDPTTGGTQASSILRSADGESFVDLHVDLLTVQLTTVAVSGSTYIAAGRKFHCQPNEAWVSDHLLWLRFLLV